MRKLKFRLIKDNKIISTQELKPNGIIDCPVEWDTACQFTGLLDRHGKDIWEGDIVLKHDGKTKAVVYWDNGKASFALDPEWCGEAEDGWNQSNQVIGNIYENKKIKGATMAMYDPKQLEEYAEAKVKEALSKVFEEIKHYKDLRLSLHSEPRERNATCTVCIKMEGIEELLSSLQEKYKIKVKGGE